MSRRTIDRDRSGRRSLDLGGRRWPAGCLHGSIPWQDAEISLRSLDVGDDASIDITDASGSIVSAESGQPRDGGSVAEGVDVAADPADPAVAVLTWTGSPCDTTHTLAIEEDGRTMTLSRPRCLGDAIPRDLQVRLTYREPIDVSTISASLVTRQG